MAKRIKSPYKAWRRYREREETCTTLRKVFDYATTKYAKKIAYQYVDGGQAYSYEEFRRKTEQLSLRMTRFGIKHGDRVAIFSQNMPNWVVAFFSLPFPCFRTALKLSLPISLTIRSPRSFSSPRG